MFTFKHFLIDIFHLDNNNKTPNSDSGQARILNISIICRQIKSIDVECFIQNVTIFNLNKRIIFKLKK